MKRFNKILIANRGEIAVRIIRTARELGYRTVAVYSDADAQALHVSVADEAVRIGPAPATHSYLRADRLLDAAASTGAGAIHPGYGFLSENADFARACERAGVVFIGPGADAIELMGSKRLSKNAMLAAGVPCIPGYQGAAQDDDVLVREARKIGFPLMVKASAGGGGRGLRLVSNAAELPQLLRTARSEALHAFGNDELILEKAIVEPRHIEIQVFADQHGNVVYLGERDCSVQRRHQKVVEESPSPFVDAVLRQRMGQAAVEAARSCDYIGAGTVEFLVDASKNFYFLEMNTRLQVEHPVTELVTGQDLVAWQLSVAAGQALPLKQSEMSLRGHAIEVRLYAEDPRNDFLPQTGTVQYWHYPKRDGIRVDHGLRTGQVISPHYDPMLAKIIAHGETRDVAIRRLASAVHDTVLLGVNQNKLFLHDILSHEAYRSQSVTTGFIAQYLSDAVSVQAGCDRQQTCVSAALLYFRRAQQDGNWQTGGWRSASTHYSHFRLLLNDTVTEIRVRVSGEGYELAVDDQLWVLRVLADDERHENRCVVVDAGGQTHRCDYVFDGPRLYLDDGAGHHTFDDVSHYPAIAADAAVSGTITAAMDGAIIDLLVAEGDRVEAGQTVAVLEAMKMEHPLKTGIAGVVRSLKVSIGTQVKARQFVASIVADATEHNADSA